MKNAAFESAVSMSTGPRRFVLQALDPDHGSPVLEALFLVTELEDLRALLDIDAGDDPELERWYTVDATGLAAIAEAAGNHPASPAFRTADARFHRVIAAAARNEILRAFTSWTLDVLQPSLIDTIGDSIDGAEILRQHGEILRAIKQRQPAAAERAMRRHLEYLQKLVEALQQRRQR